MSTSSLFLENEKVDFYVHPTLCVAKNADKTQPHTRRSIGS